MKKKYLLVFTHKLQFTIQYINTDTYRDTDKKIQINEERQNE